MPIAVWPLLYAQYISFKELGIILAVSFIWQTFLELPSGAFADVFGRRVTVILSQVFRFFGFLCVVLANSFWWLLLADILDKTFEALYSGAGEAMVYDSLKEDGEADAFDGVMSKAYTWASAIYTLASIAGGFLFLLHPKLPFVAMLVVVLLNFALSFLYKEPRIDSEKYSLKSYLKQNIDGFKHIFRNREITLIAFYSLAVSYVFLTGLWFVYQKAANEVGLAPQYVGILIAVLYGIRAFGSWIYSKRWTKKSDRKLVWLAGLQGVSSLVVALPGQLLGIFGLAGRYFSDGLRMPIVSSATNRHIESKYRATSISAISLLTSLVMAVTFPIIGWGVDLAGARMVTGVLGLVSLAIAVPLGVVISKRFSTSPSHS